MNKLISILVLFTLNLSAIGQNACPKFEWAKSTIASDGNEFSDVIDIAVDLQGNIYITGYFDGTVAFGNISLTSIGYDDIYIAKLDAYGNYLWVKQVWTSIFVPGNGSDGESYGIAVDSQGNSYITGKFYGSITFGNTTLDCDYSTDIFVAKLDAFGNFIWAKRFGGDEYERSNDIEVDLLGNIYITGMFSENTILGNTTLNSLGNQDIFVAKLDAIGNVIWAKSAGGMEEDNGTKIAVDAQGNTYISGHFEGATTIGNNILTSTFDEDIFISKLDISGNFLWAIGITGYSWNFSFDIDTQGNSYVTGDFSETITIGTTTLTSAGDDDIFIAKFDNSGDFKWAKKAGGIDMEYSSDIVVGSQDDIYITGNFKGSANFGNTTLISGGIRNIFIAKLDVSGNFIWANNEPGEISGHKDETYITTDSQGGIYVTGTFDETAIFGNTTLTTTGLFDVFVTKFGDCELSTTHLKQELFSIYPNPTNAFLNIESETQLKSITIRNLNGKLLYKKDSPKEAQIDIRNLSKGVYLIEVEAENGHSIKKIVKE